MRLHFILGTSLLGISLSVNAFDFGVCVHPSDGAFTPEKQISLMRQYNILSFRTDYPWSQVETQKGVYHPANDKIEQMIKLAKKNNIKPLIILDYGNKIYDNFSPLNPHGKPQSESSIQAFANYAGWSAQHLNDSVSTFEIWNEWIQMAGGANKITALSDNSARTYAELVTQSCKAIKAANPKAKVIAGSINPFNDNGIEDGAGEGWLLKVINYGALSCIDGLSFHPYYYPNVVDLSPEPIVNSLNSFQQKVTKINHGKNVPFYITEIGVPDIQKVKYKPETLTNYLNKLYTQLSALGYIKGVWWYELINDGTDLNNKENNFGLLNRDLSPKPTAVVFNKITSNSIKIKVDQ